MLSGAIYSMVNRHFGARREHFNRKTFDPVNNELHRKILTRLRMNGLKRRVWYSNRSLPHTQHNTKHYSCCCSPSLEALGLSENGSGVYLDLGCGNSADAAIASSWGYTGIGLDLFKPDENHEWQHSTEPVNITFIQADVAEAIPFPDNSVVAATSHAMIDLIEPEARVGFYSEVYRVLENGSLFSLTGINLANGYGYTAAEEKRRVLSVGFDYVPSLNLGFVVRKP